jgi:hypothetical protein
MTTAAAPLKFRRAKDFSFSGIYELETVDGKGRAFRDPETGAWLNPDVVTVHQPLPFEFLGWNKAEALTALSEQLAA